MRSRGVLLLALAACAASAQETELARGDELLAQGRHEAAADAYAAAAETADGDCLWCYLGVARSRLRLDQPELAERAAAAAVDLATTPAEIASANNLLGAAIFNQARLGGDWRDRRRLSALMTRAERAFRAAFEAEQGRDAQVRRNLAETLAWLGRLDEATELLASLPAGRRSAMVSTTEEIAAAIAFSEQAAARLDAGDSAGAVRSAHQAVFAADAYAPAYQVLSMALGAGGDLSAAIDAARFAAELDPEVAEYRFGLGVLQQQAGDLAAARAAYAECVRLDPAHGRAYTNLGNLRRHAGDDDGAIEAYRHALVVDPENATARANLGAVLSTASTAQRYLWRDPRLADDGAAESIDELERAVAARPTAMSLENLGNALRAAGRAGEAIAALERSIELDPGRAGAWHGAALAYAEAGRHDDAVAAAERATRLAARSPEAWNTLGNLYRDGQLWDRAAVAYRAAIAAKPAEAAYRNNLAGVRRHQGRVEEALALYREAIELDPRNPVFHLNRALSLRQLGRLEEAIDAYVEATRLDAAPPPVR